MKIKIPTPKKSVTTTEVCSFEITNSTLLQALEEAGVLPVWPEKETSKEVFVRIPGGGDWSNTNLTIESDRTITVKMTRKITTES